MGLYKILATFWVCFGVSVVVSSSAGIITTQIKPEACEVNSKLVWSDLSREAHVVCKYSRPINHCFWNVYDPRQENATAKFHFNITSDDGKEILPGYTYYGQGLAKGECGVTISKVKSNDFGNWSCLVIAEGAKFCSNSIDVSQWELPPHLPEIDGASKRSLATLVDLPTGRTSRNVATVTCCVGTGGKPDPELHYSIDTERFAPNNTHNVRKYTENGRICIQWENAVFTYKSNRKRLECVMTHVALGDRDPKSDSVDINVFYSPFAETDVNRTISIEKIEGKFSIVVTVGANPSPTFQWTTSKISKSAMQYEQPTLGDNFEVTKQQIDDLTYKSTLHILELHKMTEDDVVHFMARNKHGQIEEKFYFENEVPPSDFVTTLYIILGGVIAFIVIGILSIYIVWRIRNRRRSKQYPVSSLSPMNAWEVTRRNVSNRAAGDKAKKSKETTPSISPKKASVTVNVEKEEMPVMETEA